MPTNIIDGTDELITAHLNGVLEGKERFDTLTTFQLVAKWRGDLQLPELIQALWKRIDANWREAGRQAGSDDNWRFQPQLQIDARKNKSEEACLERGLALALPRKDWANQVPTASGLISPDSDKKRSIDIAHWDGVETVTLVELKAPSLAARTRQTPVLAAFEIIRNGLLLCLARASQGTDRPIKMAAEIWKTAPAAALRVVAPERFYPGEYPLARFEEQLNHAVTDFSVAESPRLNFAFRTFDLPNVFRSAIERSAAYKQPG